MGEQDIFMSFLGLNDDDLMIPLWDNGAIFNVSPSGVQSISQFNKLFLKPLMAWRVKRLSAMQETRVQSLGWEDPLKKEMETHSSVLARGKGAWWAAVYGVAQSRTQLKRLSSSSSIHNNFLIIPLNG